MFYLPVIGLEIHVQPKTQSKMFCGCSADIFNAEPNTHTCPVCLGLPGALPVPNKTAIEKTILLGLALSGSIAEHTRFDRKNYFYPDLPKGYQISQYKNPIVSGGELTFKSTDGSDKTVTFERIHLEEDTGKLIHVKGDEEYSLIDFNRSGMPLIEIVTGFPPQLHSAEDVRLFLRKLRQYLRYSEVSDANMEEGTMRLEPNVSVAQIDAEYVKARKSTNEIIGIEDLREPVFDLPAYKVELKNINSFKFAEKAVDYEINRQIEILKKNEIPVQETRGWDEKKNRTISQRAKEEAHDYRYFPEPDIPPMHFSREYVEVIRESLIETPKELFDMLVNEIKLTVDDAETVLEKPEMMAYFKFAKDTITADRLRELCVKVINQPELMADNPKTLLDKLQQEAANAIDDETELIRLAMEVLSENPEKVEAYKNGNENLMQFFMGQIMAKTKGKASPQVAIKVIQKSLTE